MDVVGAVGGDRQAVRLGDLALQAQATADQLDQLAADGRLDKKLIANKV
jgi:hypothetical protein